MADLTPLNFIPENVEDLGDGFKVVPPGIYSVIITDSKVVDTKKKDGKRLVLVYQIVEGPNTGDTVEDGLNVMNPNPKAEAIGMSQLKNICDAVGHVGHLPNSELLHGKPLSVKVSIKPSDTINPKTGVAYDNNDIDKRMAKQAPQQSPMPAASEAPEAGGQQSMPWG
jgi:hypothetical protein